MTSNDCNKLCPPAAGPRTVAGAQQPPLPAPSDPLLDWLPDRFAPLESELADFKAAAVSLDQVARQRLAAAARGMASSLARVAQARLWRRGQQLLLLDGRLTPLCAPDVTAEQLKRWLQSDLTAGVNLGSAKWKPALTDKAVRFMLKEVEALPESEAAVRQRIAELAAAAAAAPMATAFPMPTLPMLPQFGGLPFGFMPNMPLGLPLGSLMQWPAAEGAPGASSGIATASGAQFFSLPNLIFQDAHPPAL